MFDQELSHTILFKKNQATTSGVDLKNFRTDKESRLYKDQKVFSGAVIFDYIIPIMKTSGLGVYKGSQPFQTNYENSPEYQNNIIIGRGFLERFRLTASNKMTDTMGACGEHTFTRITNVDDVELWNYNIEDLGLYRVLRSCQKDFMIGTQDADEQNGNLEIQNEDSKCSDRRGRNNLHNNV